MKKLMVKLFIFWFSIKRIFQLTLGDEVSYKNRKYTLIQGVCDPYWDLFDGENRVKRVPKNNFKKILSLKNVIHDFKFAHRFYMGYWYNIWMREPYKKIRTY